MSASALADVLKEVAEHGLPELHSRSAMYEATSALLDEVTIHGKLLHPLSLTLTTGEKLDTWAVNPFAFMYHANKQGGGFHTLLKATMEKERHSIDNPLRIIAYSDEVVPGKELSHHNKRKLWCIYFSFAEFLPVFHLEETWMPLVLMRSDLVTKCAAGISQVFAAALKLFFGALPSNFQVAGIVLHNPDGSLIRIFGKMWMVLQDGGAHKLLWHCKGDSGTKICMLCRDMIGHDSGEVDEDGIPIVVCPDMSVDTVDLCTDNDIRGSVDRLATFAGTAEYALRAQAAGYNHEPHGILLNDDLRPIVEPASQYCHDWMHAICVSGVVNTIIFLLLAALTAGGFTHLYETLHDYIEGWHLPGSQGSTPPKDLFLKRRQTSNQKGKTFKALASEILSLYGILAVFVCRVALRAGIAPDACNAFLALCDLLDILQMCNLGKCIVGQLSAAVTTFLQKCKDAGWHKWMIPKFHWLIHLPYHYGRFCMLPTCWVHERKHKVAKQYGGHIHNTTTFEKSMIGEVVSHNLAALSTADVFDTFPALVNPSRPRAALHGFIEERLGMSFSSSELYVASRARIIPAGYVCKGDVVIARSQELDKYIGGEVMLIIEAMGQAMILLNVYTPTAFDQDEGVCDWNTRPTGHLIDLVDIWSPLVYNTLGVDSIRSLIPWVFRKYEPSSKG